MTSSKPTTANVRLKKWRLVKGASEPAWLDSEPNEKTIAFRDAVEQLYLEAQAEGRLNCTESEWRKTLALAGLHAPRTHVVYADGHKERSFMLQVMIREGLREEDILSVHALIFG